MAKKLKTNQEFVVRSMIASLHTECKVLPFLIADVQVKSLSASSSEQYLKKIFFTASSYLKIKRKKVV
jgi:hypothetical protein